MRIRFRILIIIVVMVAIASSMLTTASAVVITLDEFTAGDGNITRDTDQNLDFLDVDQTMGLSYNQIEATLLFGGDNEGYRFATSQEIVNLMNNSGFAGPAVTNSPDRTFETSNLGSLTGLMTQLTDINNTSFYAFNQHPTESFLTEFMTNGSGADSYRTDWLWGNGQGHGHPFVGGSWSSHPSPFSNQPQLLSWASVSSD